LRLLRWVWTRISALWRTRIPEEAGVPEARRTFPILFKDAHTVIPILGDEFKALPRPTQGPTILSPNTRESLFKGPGPTFYDTEGETISSSTVPPHHASHESGGSDQIGNDKLNPQNADQLQAVAIDTTAPSDGQVLQYVSASGKWTPKTPSGGNFILVQETILGASATDVDFSGLDINTHKAYLLVWKWKNLGDASNALFLYMNGDYTNSDYYRQQFSVDDVTVTSHRANDSEFTNTIPQNADAVGSVLIQRDPDGYVRAITQNSEKGPSAMILSVWTIAKSATVANLTSLRIHSYEASGMAAGSRFALYRVT
jgi:hypothetical protein